ncbi:hypothetical protein [Streptomyces sp. NPDC001809]
MPGDWDGGWRRAAPPLLTLSRAPLGVSDGLAFRSGLAAWQNPSFDSGMGHALLPTAPTGLVHGATRPATPRTTDSGGGPLLLRAVRADGTPEPPHAPAAPDSGPPARPSSGGRGTAASSSSRSGGPRGTAAPSEGRSASGRPPSRDLSLTTSPAVLSAPEPAAVQRAAAASADGGGTSATAPVPLVRRVAVVPVAPRTREAFAPRPATGPARTTATETGVARESSPRVKGDVRGSTARGSTAREGAASSGARVAPGGGRSQPSSPPVVRPRPVGARLTVARRVPGTARPVPALRPAAPAAPRQDRTTAATDAPPATPPGHAEPTGTAASDPAAPSPAVQRAAARTVLGAPLPELPPTASTTPTSTTPTTGTPSPAPGAGLPIVQRQTEGTPRDMSGVSASDPVSPGRSGAGARARGGLGAPLSAMPASATPPAGSTASGARPGRPAPGPGVQRAPAPPAGERPSPAAPRADASAPEAPLLGATDVQRRITDHPASPGADRTDRTPGGAPVVRTPGSAAPPSGGAPRLAAGREAVGPHTAPGGSGSTSPVPVVVARAVSGPGTHPPGAAPGSGGDRSGTAGPPPTPAPASTTGPKPNTGPKATTGSKPTAGRQAGPGPKPGTAAQRAAGPSGTVRASDTPGTGLRPTSGSASRIGAGGGRPAFAPYLGSPANGPVPVARRTIALLPARPLRLSTGAAEGLAPSAASRAVSGPPVVAARWNTARDAPGGPAHASPPGGGGASAPVQRTASPVQRTASASVRGAGTASVQRAASASVRGAGAAPVQRTASAPVRGAAAASVQRAASPPRGLPASGAVPPPSTRPDAPGPFAAPTVQRAATAPGPWPAAGGAVAGAPAGGAQVPVVRLAPPGGGTSAAPARSLPVAPPQAPPVTHGPSAPGTPAPGAPVPVVRPRGVTAAAPSSGGGTAPRIQRAVPDTGRSASATPAVPVKEVPARGKQASSSAPAAAGRSTGRNTGRDAEPAQDPGLDLDDLARRLLDPMARLLRTELRRGRERTGRPYDGRR